MQKTCPPEASAAIRTFTGKMLQALIRWPNFSPFSALDATAPAREAALDAAKKQFALAAKAAAEQHLKEVEEQEAANPGKQGHFLKSMFGFKSDA